MGLREFGVHGEGRHPLEGYVYEVMVVEMEFDSYVPGLQRGERRG